MNRMEDQYGLGAAASTAGRPPAGLPFRPSKQSVIFYVLCLWAALFGFNIQPGVADLYFIRDLPPGFAPIMHVGRPIVVLGVLGLLMLGLASGSTKFAFSNAIGAFVLFRFILAVRRMVAFPELETLVKESLGFILICSFLAAFTWRNKWTHSAVGYTRTCARVAFLVWLPYVGTCALLAVFRPGAVFNRPGRLFGLNGHPNEFAISISLLMILALYGLAVKRKFWTSLFVVCLTVWMVILSGSRVGMLTCFCATIPFLLSAWERSGGLTRAFLATCVFPLTLVVAVAASVFTYLADMRVFSTTNTRGEVFSSLFDNFIGNPLFGNPAGTGATSNSFLYAASSTGILGLVFVLALIVYLGSSIIKIRALPALERRLLIFSGLAVGCSMMFSGYLCEYVQFPLVYTLLWMTLLSRFSSSMILLPHRPVPRCDDQAFVRGGMR